VPPISPALPSACPTNTGATAWTRKCATPAARPWKPPPPLGRRSCPFPSRIRPMPWRPITSWPWPKPRPTFRVSTACATASAILRPSPWKTSTNCRAPRASARKSSAASSSAPMCSRPGTTTPTTARPPRSAGSSARISSTPSPNATCFAVRPRRLPPMPSARCPTIPCKCI